MSDPYRDQQNQTYWLPALAVPARSKARFSCPQSHLDTLVGDLPNVTTVVTIGWRGREQHFLDLLATHLSPGTRLLVVAEHETSAMTTVDEVWSTPKSRPVCNLCGRVLDFRQQPDCHA